MPIFRNKSLARHRGGTAAVEFGLLAPLVIMGLVGTVETGRAFWTRATLQFAAEEAARYAMVNADAGDAELIARAEGQLLGMSGDGVTVTVNRETVNDTDFVTIEASYPFSYLVSMIPGGPMTLTGSARASLSP